MMVGRLLSFWDGIFSVASGYVKLPGGLPGGKGDD